MLWVLRDDSGRLLSACEWHLVNEQGKLCAEGTYVWLEQLELSQGASMSQCARQMIEDISSRCPWTVAVYWMRLEKTGMKLHQYTRNQVLRYECKEIMV